MRFLATLLAIALSVGPAVAQQDTTSSFSAGRTDDGTVAGQELLVDAKLTKKSETIERGLVWRVFADAPNEAGRLPLVATKSGGTASFQLPVGDYLVHAGFGRASAVRRVSLREGGAVESFVLDAGGLQLDAVSANLEIPPARLRFAIYGLGEGDVDEDERPLIAANVAANEVIRLKEGTYHVVSYYGKINASVRADLEVEAGKVTKATLQHRGAAITLKLVSEAGGTPVANTAWAVLTDSGEKVFESNTVSPTLVLSEGLYEASVRNGEETFVENFEVKAGEDRSVEVLLSR